MRNGDDFFDLLLLKY